MDDQKIFNISLFLTLIGILILIIIADNQNLEEIAINNITEKDIDQKVKISGYIEDIYETEGLYIFSIINQDSKIKSILFKDNNSILYEGLEVDLEGVVTEYEGELEITAKKITVK